MELLCLLHCGLQPYSSTWQRQFLTGLWRSPSSWYSESLLFLSTDSLLTKYNRSNELDLPLKTTKTLGLPSCWCSLFLWLSHFDTLIREAMEWGLRPTSLKELGPLCKLCAGNSTSGSVLWVIKMWILPQFLWEDSAWWVIQNLKVRSCRHRNWNIQEILSYPEL